MKTLMPFLSIVAICSVSVAQDNPALLITDGGYYYVVVDDGGTPTVEKVTKVIDFRDGTPNPPEPPDDADITDKVKQWAEEVNHPQGARALAIIYQTVADNVANGTLDPGDAFDAVKKATDQILDTVGGEGKWGGFRDKLGDVIVDRLQHGELTSQDDIATFLRKVAEGLDASEGAKAALSPEFIRLIIQLIIKVINLFVDGGDIGDNIGGGPV